MIEWLKDIDTQLFLLCNGTHSPFWDKIMWFCSGKISWLPLYIFILYLIIKNFRKKSWVIVLGVILLITLSDQSSVRLFKNTFERLRPCHNPEIEHLVHLVNNKCGSKFGFVSSHAANTFALAMFTLLLLRSEYYSWFILFWAAIVSYSRVYLGNHYPGDIIGGAILGILLGWFVYFLVNWINRLLKTT